MTHSRPTLQVFADLTIDIAGHPATIVGNGRQLVVETTAPLQLWRELSNAALPAAVGRVNGPRALGRVGAALQQQQLELRITAGRGDLVRLGGPGKSLLGRIVTGSAAVHLGSVSALAAVWPQLPATGKLLPAAGVIGGVAAAILVNRNRRNRRTKN